MKSLTQEIIEWPGLTAQLQPAAIMAMAASFRTLAVQQPLCKVLFGPHPT